MFKCVEHRDVAAAAAKAEAEQQDGGSVGRWGKRGGEGHQSVTALGSNACDSGFEKYAVLSIFQPRG